MVTSGPMRRNGPPGLAENMKALLVLLAASVLSAACTTPAAGPIEARAELRKTNESGVESSVSGWANMTESRGSLTILLAVRGLPQGSHGVHVHEVGDCGAKPGNSTNPTPTPGGKAGGHFNPDAKPHGQHAGDLGNVAAGSDGRGIATFHTSAVSLDPKSANAIGGRTVVVHALHDDGTPTANFGARTLCGLVILL